MAAETVKEAMGVISSELELGQRAAAMMLEIFNMQDLEPEAFAGKAWALSRDFYKAWKAAHGGK